MIITKYIITKKERNLNSNNRKAKEHHARHDDEEPHRVTFKNVFNIEKVLRAPMWSQIHGAPLKRNYSIIFIFFVINNLLLLSIHLTSVCMSYFRKIYIFIYILFL